MSPRLQITARDFELKDWIKDEITRKAEKLDEYYSRIIRCRVVIEIPHHHRREGILYNVRIDMTVPGRELVVEREPNQDFNAAIRDSFDTAYRILEEYSQKQRGEVKLHEGPPVARISKLFPDEGYGILTTPDGADIYFHENSVIKDDFARLAVGMEVRFTEEQGEKGPQASSVIVVERKSPVRSSQGPTGS